MAKNKFYAVKAGRVPGIYLTWDDCKRQIDGYKGAKYHGFGSAAEAQEYLEADEKQSGVKKKTSESVMLPDGPYSFVDGSFNPDTNTYGYGGFLCVQGRRYPLSGCGHDTEMASMRNVAGEIYGARAAVEKAEELGIRELTILYDYKGIEEWACGNWKCNKDGTTVYRDFMQDDTRKVSIKFQKVPAHTGIEGNEMADVMAKHAVGVPLTKSQKELLQEALSNGKRDGVDSIAEQMTIDETTFSL